MTFVNSCPCLLPVQLSRQFPTVTQADSGGLAVGGIDRRKKTGACSFRVFTVDRNGESCGAIADSNTGFCVQHLKPADRRFVVDQFKSVGKK